MFTWEEVAEIVKEAMTSPPDKLMRTVADYIPQNAMTQLMDDIYDHSVERTGDQEIAHVMTAQFMMGFHVAWHIATRAMKK
jgi:hypothetical protein